jgi:ATP-dependent DNA helicase RecG
MQRLGAAQLPRQPESATTVEPGQRVLDYLTAHGRITRKETAALCQISDLQARDLLQRLVRQGKLVRRGQKRGAFYLLASKSIDVSNT